MPPLIVLMICILLTVAGAAAILVWHLYQDSRRHRSQDAEMRQHLRRINCE